MNPPLIGKCVGLEHDEYTTNQFAEFLDVTWCANGVHGKERIKIKPDTRYILPIFNGKKIKIKQIKTKPRLPKKPPTERKKERETQYRAAKKDFKAATDGKCQVCTKAQGTDIHHKKGRIGNLLTDTTYLLLVCRSCHRIIHDNPRWAKEKGYTELRGK